MRKKTDEEVVRERGKDGGRRLKKQGKERVGMEGTL